MTEPTQKVAEQPITQVASIGAPISFEDFLKIDMRIGRILAAQINAKARKPAYKLTIDFGPLGQKQSSAQITKNYKPEELVGRLIVAVVNFPPKNVAGVVSEVLVLGADDPTQGVILLAPDLDANVGTKIA